MDDFAIARSRLDGLDVTVFSEAGRNLEVLIFIRPGGFDSVSFRHAQHQIRLPDAHPSTNFGAGGKSFAAPSIAPPSTQAVIVSISVWVRRRSFWNWPSCGSACQGGITRLATFSRMDLAHGRTSLKLSAEKGAFSPGRWHSAQLLKKIGATSLLKVIFFA